jgi:hypothetical protein
MKNIIYILFKLGLLLLFLYSLFAWFLWNQNIFSILLAFFLSFLFYLSSPDNFTFRKNTAILIILLFFSKLLAGRTYNLFGVIAVLLNISVLAMVLLLKDEIKIKLFRFFTNAFAVLLTVSMVAWTLFLVGVSLPNYDTQFMDNQYVFTNYYVFLLNLQEIDVIIPRFSSIFLEPGQLGMITIFFLVANRFELKRKSVLVIFIATLLTFSLAAYVMLIISTSVYVLLHLKRPILNFMVLIIIYGGIYVYFTNLNNGDNPVNTLIFNRLQYDNGIIAGNNRFSDTLDTYFGTFIKSENNFFGIGSAEFAKMDWGKGVAGYKVFIIQYGIVGTLLVFLFYVFVVLSNQSRMAWVLLLVYVLCFIQAAYALWECELLIFITAIPLLGSQQQKE